MKAIETFYKGIKFRSRVEARWAVFFDTIGYEWEYEKEGFVLDDGTCYLPDFYLSRIDTWVEVKGKDFTEEERRKCKMLSMELKSGCVLMVQCMPEKRQYPCYFDGVLFYVTISYYVLVKKWTYPYIDGDWWNVFDNPAFIASRSARFEFGNNGTF